MLSPKRRLTLTKDIDNNFPEIPRVNRLPREETKDYYEKFFCFTGMSSEKYVIFTDSVHLHFLLHLSRYSLFPITK